METINHECYVSLEVAKLLKEAGFDWKCRGIYVLDSENDPEYVFSTANFTNTSKEIEGYMRLSAPTLDVAQRWLMEVKGIYIGIVALEDKRCVTDSDTGLTFHYEYMKPLFYCDIQNERCETISTLDDSYSIYEEAQEAGIKKALEIILEKGK